MPSEIDVREHCGFGCVAFLSICQVLLLHNWHWRGLLRGLVCELRRLL